METGFSAPTAEARAELREKGSRFLAIVAPAVDEQAAKALIEATRKRHTDASHVCWAWRLGMPAQERFTDAGEPAGTAGLPILQVLRGREISDAVAIAVRWFGGVKLGKGGLARAYAGAARLAVEELPLSARVPRTRLVLNLPYERVGGVKRLVHPPDIELVEQEYGEWVRIVLSVIDPRLKELEDALAELGVAVDRD